MSAAIQDLGPLHGPVLIFGGCYSNLQATQALQLQAERLGIAPQQVICNGDVVAYCAEPQATVDLIRGWGVPVVQGNCEQALAEGADDCGCGFDTDSACDLLSVAWYRYARLHIDAPDRAWMAALPQSLSFQLAGRKFLVVHGGLSANNRFIFGSSPETLFAQELTQTDADVVIGGHCGLPFAQTLGERYWLNSGVIGMPANDATQDGWYLLLEPREGAIECRWQRLSYAAELASGQMTQAGLPDAYAHALQTGLWPSMAVLPERERAQQAQPLSLPSLRILTD
ncbi:MAG: putative phosphodiesterase [Motiliproteus sp.]|jgi:predicted phosphodiesterase